MITGGVMDVFIILEYAYGMSKMEEIKSTVAQLSPVEQASLRDWLEELAEQRFDEQIERDEKAGKLDKLTQRALDNLRDGRVRDLLRHRADADWKD